MRDYYLLNRLGALAGLTAYQLIARKLQCCTKMAYIHD